MSNRALLLLFAALALLPLSSASANSELDRRFSLSSIGLLRSWDNIDGLFGDYVLNAYREHFAKQSRFRIQDLSKSEALLGSSKVPYKKLIEDPKILGLIARAARVETIIRTEITQTGALYNFKIEWLQAPTMRLLSSDEFALKDLKNGAGMADMKESLQQAVDRMIRKLPFMASVTGRDGDAVTVNIGANVTLQKGDTLVVGTIEEAKEHPLLKAIVDWRILQTGKLAVDQAEEQIAFTHIIEEDHTHQVAREQKIMELIPRPPEKEKLPEGESEHDEIPRLGSITGGLDLGSFSRERSDSTGAGVTGGGAHVGASAEGELWLTRQVFGNLGLKFGSAGYTQKDITGTSTDYNLDTSGSITGFKINAGFSYLLTNDFFGPKGWLKVGYHTASYSFGPAAPATTLSLTASQIRTATARPVSFKSMFLGLGGDLPIRGNFGATLDVAFGLFSSASEDAAAPSTINSASDSSFTIAGYYHYTTKMTFRCGIGLQTNGADYSNGDTLSQKLFTISPSVVYYF